MKTRIVSGIIMIAAVAIILVLGLNLHFGIILGVMALIAAVGMYELLHNATGLENKIALIAAAAYTAATVVFVNIETISNFKSNIITPQNLAIIYFLLAVVIIIFYHEDFDITRIIAFSVMPLFLGFAFARICGIIALDKGIYYLLLMLNFSSICDMGAYFAGSFFGKHKLCPAISPKKTVEGAIGGVVASLVFTVVFVLCFGMSHKILFTLLLTVPFCIIGMLGDLFASVIKRAVGIKDYGNLIPGHGGILDRFDSMLLIAPFLYMYAEVGVI